MSELTPIRQGLFGSARADGRPSSGLARQTKRELEHITARAEIEAVAEQTRAFATAQALNNVATLIAQAEAHMKTAPAGAEYYEALIASYAINAGARIGRL
ncbi:hypothetical protein [Agrococcus sp. Ld7]|uniref:hypothetical protein n=1 Tax=Agrococcus sp. Ld7 TaxID=649148 RepID=UPI00386B1580